MKNFLSVIFIIGIIVFVGISLTEDGTQRVTQNSKSDTGSSVSLTPVDEDLTAVNNDISVIKCNGEPTIALDEGPFYKEGSPKRINIRTEDKSDGNEKIEDEILTLSGYVLNTECQPIQNAWLDFWQTNGQGDYDNTGYRFRGHQFTDTNGFYILETVVPSEYPGRTPHIHVKIRATEESPIITTQLFLPDTNRNEIDSIFDKSLTIDLKEGDERMIGSYNFVLNTEI